MDVRVNVTVKMNMNVSEVENIDRFGSWVMGDGSGALASHKE